ncbi:Rtr1/RPAP2 family-domain-containing protein [Tirmania nivea]|nr:Rtr1/RPAP2 family-domain-containing protein [Tirmania nivea]
MATTMANNPVMKPSSHMTGPPPKSILKKPSAAASGALQTSKSAKVQAHKTSNKSPLTGKVSVQQGRIGPNGRRLHTPEEAREIALYHAHIIQNQKNLELAILESVELLLDFPTTNNPASCPSDTDVTELKKNLVHFQPSDFDDLIEERNIVRKCGYPLCPLQNKLQPTKVKFRVLDKGRRIVETKQLERFCSDECARRGLWIRVQLHEEPSWLRVGADGQIGRGGAEYKITLLEEEKEKQREASDKLFKGDLRKLVDQLQGMGISGSGLSATSAPTQAHSATGPATDSLANQLQQAMVLSGEGGAGTQVPKSATPKVSVNITERVPGSSSNAEPPKAPKASLNNIEEDKLAVQIAAMAVEGYTPKGPNKDLASKWREAVAAGKNNDDDSNED